MEGKKRIDLMFILEGDRLKSIMTRLKVPEDMPIEQKMITKMLETAQKKVEGHNFDIRKHLLEYDDVLNKHREVVYKKRRQALAPTTSLKEMILDLIEQEVEFVVSFHTNVEDRKEWNLQEVYETASTIFPFSDVEKEELLKMNTSGDTKLEDVEARDSIVKFFLSKAEREYEAITKQATDAAGNEAAGAKLMRDFEKNILLRSIDSLWVDHLVAVDYLRTGIGLRGYGQRDPLVEYKKETYQMFNALLSGIQKEVVYSF